MLTDIARELVAERWGNTHLDEFFDILLTSSFEKSKLGGIYKWWLT